MCALFTSGISSIFFCNLEYMGFMHYNTKSPHLFSFTFRILQTVQIVIAGRIELSLLSVNLCICLCKIFSNDLYALRKYLPFIMLTIFVLFFLCFFYMCNFLFVGLFFQQEMLNLCTCEFVLLNLT